MSRKGLAKVEITTETDSLTGEILNQTKLEVYEQYTVNKKQYKFAMISKESDIFLQLKTALDYKVIYLLVDYTDRVNEVVAINKYLKEQIALRLGFSIKAIEKSINSLVEVNAITPVSRGIYSINPEIIFIGGTVNISNKISTYNILRESYSDSKYNVN